MSADWHNFWRADEDDGLYNAGGGLSRAGSLGTSKGVGSEIDLTFKYAFSKRAVCVLGYSHFFAGDFIEESGSSNDIDFAHLTLKLSF